MLPEGPAHHAVGSIIIIIIISINFIIIIIIIVVIVIVIIFIIKLLLLYRSRTAPRDPVRPLHAGTTRGSRGYDRSALPVAILALRSQ